VVLGLLTLAATAPLRGRIGNRLRAMLVLLLGGALGLAVAGGGAVLALEALSEQGVQYPGAHRVHMLAARIPQPWKAPKPIHVPAPAPVAAPVGAAGEPAGQSVAPAGATAASNAVVQPATVASAAASTEAASSVPAGAAVPAAGTIAASPSAQSTASAAATQVAAPPAAAKIDGVRHMWQNWNNCGPATITMAASVFGKAQSQAHAAAFLKPNANDKNVSPHELASYARSLGLEADVRSGGTLDKLKALLANGVPVVVEIWYAPEPDDWMGHYRLLVGYDDATQRVTFFDSFQAPGQNVQFSYGRFDTEWRVFNRTYIPVYQPEQAPKVAAILGADRDDKVMFERGLSVAQAEVKVQANDAFAWFNTGSNLAGLGRHAEAVAAFDKARSLKLPFRMLWYQFGAFESYLAEGRYGEVIALADANLQHTKDLEESHYYKGRALQAQGQKAAARASYQAALRANPKHVPSQHALASLD
jgi:tetratricopeptide (TPR) repeat protein